MSEKKAVTALLEMDDYNAAKAAAEGQGISMAAWARHAIQDKLAPVVVTVGQDAEISDEVLESLRNAPQTILRAPDEVEYLETHPALVPGPADPIHGSAGLSELDLLREFEKQARGQRTKPTRWLLQALDRVREAR